MHYILLYLINLLVFPSMFITALLIFRQPIRVNLRSILLSTLIFSSISPLFNWLGMAAALTAVSLLVAIFCFYFVFQYRMMPSLVMTTVSILISLIAEITYYLIVSSLHNISFAQKAQELDFMGSVAIGVANYLVSFLLFKWRLGFSFLFIKQRKIRDMPQTYREHKYNLVLFTLLLYISSIAIVLFFWEHYYIVSVSTITVLFFAITTWLFKREWQDG